MSFWIKLPPVMRSSWTGRPLELPGAVQRTLSVGHKPTDQWHASVAMPQVGAKTRPRAEDAWTFPTARTAFVQSGMQVQRCKPGAWIEWDGIVLVRYFPVAGDFFVTGRHAPPHVDRRADRCGPSHVM
jgi:hypothetical protein